MNTNENGLAGMNPPIGIQGKPYVMQIMSPTFLRPKYAITNDIITDKICTPNEDDTLSIMNSDYLKGKKIRVFKYKKNDGKIKLDKILESLNKPVSREFIYESLADKEMLNDAQIYIDEDFEEIKFDDIKDSIINETYTVLNKYIQSVPDLAKNCSVINTLEASIKLKGHSDSVVIMENSNGYFACNRNTLRRTKYYSNINDIRIGSDIDG